MENTNRSAIGSSKIQQNGQVTIPKEARKALSLEPGDTVVFYLENDKLFLKK